MVLMGVDEAPVFPFQAYPGMEIFDQLVEKGEIVVNDEYLNGLATLSTGKFTPPDFCFSEHVSKTELYLFRLAMEENGLLVIKDSSTLEITAKGKVLCFGFSLVRKIFRTEVVG